MSIGHNVGPPLSDAQTWTQIFARYREPSHLRSAGELVVTALPLVALWSLAWLTYSFGYWWASLLIAIPAAVFLLRLFVIQHDCGHGSFFRYKWTNDWVGRVLGVFTMTPYDFWRRMHAIHHSTSGNLDKRGYGDIDTLTVREYLSRKPWGRFKYRLYRNPVVLFLIGPAYMFLLQHRLPIGLMRNNGWLPWVSTQVTNIAIALISAVVIWLVGLKFFLFVHVPMVVIAASIGVWLFYVQHQFEDTHWSSADEWEFHEASMLGSSYYDLPVVLRWLTGNIGIHHVHHACSRIPYYHLPRVLRDHPDLRELGRLTLLKSFRCVSLALWDEEQKRLVTFRDVKP